MYRRTPRRHDGNAVAMMLLSEIIRFWNRQEVKPYVTVAFIALMSWIYFEHVFRPNDVCIEPSAVLRDGLFGFFPRAFASAMTHGDAMHLFYNMVSFLHKGHQMEVAWGSVKIGVVLVGLTLVCNVIYVALGPLLELGGVHTGCAVGWSAVIFALKVITQRYSLHTHEFIQGMRVPAAAAAWCELVLISLVTPNASFVGHLAGILAGLLFIAGEKVLGGGPRAQPRARAGGWGRAD